MPRCDRVGMEADAAVAPVYRILVAIARACVGHEQLPQPGAPERAHRQRAIVPAVEIANERNASGRRCPHHEADARSVSQAAHMRAEHVPELPVPALAHEMQIEVADRRQERVRVTARFGEARVAQPVVDRHAPCGQPRLVEPAGVDLAHFDLGALAP